MAPSAQARRRKFWGWGFEGDGLSEQERRDVLTRAAAAFGVDSLPTTPPPAASEITLRAPRLQPPSTLADRLSTEPQDRLEHAYGKSFADSVRAFERSYPEPPDVVAFPSSEDEVRIVLDWADSEGAAVIPYGGGSSVCGGVEPAVGSSYRATVSLDLRRLDQVLEVDTRSRAARVQAGVLGPYLEEQLRPHGLTLRHFPQSFEQSTLGGWIATRSGGHYATLYTHIDDFVEALRVVTPKGVLATRRLPGSGAGPDPNRLLIGSEGTLGVITEAWMRLQDRPRHRASATAAFPTFQQGAEAVRRIAQTRLFPANCRLIDAQEAATSGAGDGVQALLVLGFESAHEPVDQQLGVAMELVGDSGGSAIAGGQGGHRTGAAGAWRDAFLRAPYFREVLTPAGIIADTFESAITWDRLESFHAAVTARMLDAIREVSGHSGSVTCRFTHAYPDGAAPYFSFRALGQRSALLQQWRELKAAANEIVVRSGGTITHHHAVGRDHRPGWEQERDPLFGAALRAAKAALDPKGLLNPGVLFDPVKRTVGVTGAMA